MNGESTVDIASILATLGMRRGTQGSLLHVEELAGVFSFGEVPGDPFGFPLRTVVYAEKAGTPAFVTLFTVTAESVGGMFIESILFGGGTTATSVIMGTGYAQTGNTGTVLLGGNLGGRQFDLDKSNASRGQAGSAIAGIIAAVPPAPAGIRFARIPAVVGRELRLSFLIPPGDVFGVESAGLNEGLQFSLLTRAVPTKLPSC